MKKRRKSRWPALLLVVLVLAATAFILLRFVFVVRSVDVEGTAGMTAEDIIRHAKVHFGESIFRVNEDEIRRSLHETGSIALDGIETHYPDGLTLKVRQRMPAAMMMHAGRILVLDEEACAMESRDNAPGGNLIFVSDFGVTGFHIGERVSTEDEGQTEDFCAVMQAIGQNNAAALVSELNLANGNNLLIITRRGTQVELGDRSNMADKIAWMKSAVTDLESRGQRGGILDVSSGTKADYRAS